MADMDSLSAREELEEVAEALRDADEREKAAKKEKEDLRTVFFDLITEVVTEEVPLASKAIKVTPDTDIDQWMLLNHLGWVVVNTIPEEDMIVVYLQEDPSLIKFEIEVGGYKFGRTVQVGTPDFDIDGFVTEVRGTDYEEVLEEETVYSVSEVKAQRLLADHPEVQTIFERFTKPKPPRPMLLPIREVKEYEE